MLVNVYVTSRSALVFEGMRDTRAVQVGARVVHSAALNRRKALVGRIARALRCTVDTIVLVI